MSIVSAPKFHDVIAHLVDAAGFDEATKTNYHKAVNEHYKDDIEALTDEEKELRRAPVDVLAGSMPAIFVGGITQVMLDRIIATAIKNYETAKASAVAAPADTPALAEAATPTATVAAAPAATVAAPADPVPTDEQIAAFLAKQGQ